MKTVKLLTALPVLMLMANLSMAKIWRVNNITGVNANCTTLQAAHDSAAVGDTIAVEGSAVTYGSCTVTKRLHIMGAGYFLAENPFTQAKLAASIADYIYFNAGSSGSVVTGMSIAYLEINTSNIFVIRNLITRGNLPFNINANNSNIVIKQNYIYSSYYNNAMNIAGGCSNIIIANNYIAGYGGYISINAASNSNLEITQNVLNGNLTVYYSNITNNILFNLGSYTGSNNGTYNNINTATAFGTANGNQENVNIANIFATGSSDGQYKLKVGSPAIAAGLNGEDCGMFGGSEPYVLSGIPAAPTIYQLTSPTSGSGAQGLPVHVKVKSHN